MYLCLEVSHLIFNYSYSGNFFFHFIESQNFIFYHFNKTLNWLDWDVGQELLLINKVKIYQNTQHSEFGDV